ncbi:Uncharacterised protein [Enterobacter hormaechei]|nr:Uncharacterised protein [Enterobacter hormaechei]
MTPAELSEKLWDNAERVAKYLLPRGHLEGKEWCAGNTNGDAGKSLKINLGGKKTWADFASGDSGDLLDLWVLVRNCQLHDAMKTWYRRSVATASRNSRQQLLAEQQRNRQTRKRSPIWYTAVSGEKNTWAIRLPVMAGNIAVVG